MLAGPPIAADIGVGGGGAAGGALGGREGGGRDAGYLVCVREVVGRHHPLEAVVMAKHEGYGHLQL